MRALQGRRVAVVSGDGLVARSEHGLLVAHGHPDAIATLLTDQSPDAATGMDELRRTATREPPEGITGVIVVTAADGDLMVTATGPERVHVDGVEPPAEHDGNARIHRVQVDADVRLGLAAGWSSAAHDLRDGRVPGAGVALLTAATSADGVDTPVVHRTRTLTTAYDLTVRAAQRLRDAPGPPGGAPAPPGTAQLQIGTTRTVKVDAGEPPGQVTQPYDVGTGPPAATAGFIVFDDGVTVAVDRSYVIGRQPPDDDGTPLVVDDHEHSVSRIHARLHPEAGRALVSDAGSSNGTHLWDATASSWRRLAAGEPTPLAPDTYVAVGKRVFVYVTEAPQQPTR